MGNASTIEEFEIGIREGKFAGNVPEDKKRYGSWNTVGVDCSGLLTICWELPKKIATRDIPEYATIIKCIDEIQQGDVFAKIGSHVKVPVKYHKEKRMLLNYLLKSCCQPMGTFDVDLTKLEPIIYSGKYHGIGELLGSIGDFNKSI